MHGYMSSKESFYYQTEFLSKYFCVISFDFAGFGKSQQPEAPFSVGDYADWVIKLACALKLNNPHIIAHSFGARVALKLLGEKNFSAEKLIITGGAGIVKPRSPQYIRRVKAYRCVKKVFPRFADKHFGSKEYKSLSPTMRESYKKIVNEDLRSVARNIKNQTLLLYGENDKVTPYKEEGEIFKNAIQNSQLQIIAGGHFCFSEYPQLFNQKIYAFLKE